MANMTVRSNELPHCEKQSHALMYAVLSVLILTLISFSMLH